MRGYAFVSLRGLEPDTDYQVWSPGCLLHVRVQSNINKLPIDVLREHTVSRSARKCLDFGVPRATLCIPQVESFTYLV